MDVLRLRIPYGFIRTRASLTWADVMFGLEQELLDQAAPRELAMQRLAESSAPDSNLIDLAEASVQVDPLQTVKTLAAGEPVASQDETREKWLFLALSWILENQDSYSDPLEMAEMVYADFDYPVSIAPLVRYMPSSEPRLGSPVFERARLFANWRAYLEEMGRRFSPSPATSS